MAYEIHIERETPISPEEWKAAVEGNDNTRIAEGQVSKAKNPKTGEVISIQGSGVDVEILLNGDWVKAFHFSPSGRVSFRPSRNFDAGDSLREVAVSLAMRLNASVVGDEGETYT